MLRAIAIAIALQSTAASAETYAIPAGRLIVDASEPARGPSTVIVENGRIARIEEGATAPAGDRQRWGGGYSNRQRAGDGRRGE